MTIILLQQLAIKRLAEYVECVWRSRSGEHRENYSQKHTQGLYPSYSLSLSLTHTHAHTHLSAEWCNKHAGLWPGHVTNGPLERVQRNISQSKLMPF